MTCISPLQSMGIGPPGVNGSVVVLHVVEEVNIEIGLVLILHLNMEELIVQEMKPVRLPAIQCHALVCIS